MPPSRKRRAQSQNNSEEDNNNNDDDVASPPQRRRLTQSSQSQSQSQSRNIRLRLRLLQRAGESSAQGAARRNHRVRSETVEEGEDLADDGDGDGGGDDDDDDGDGDGDGDGGDEDGETHGEINRSRLVKRLVRLALATEYTRQPMKRVDISSKVLGKHGKMFKEVFDQAQTELRLVFGMQMEELPLREKTSLSQRRAAQRSDRTATTSKAYILTTTLPPTFRNSSILVPHGRKESSYTGVLSLITTLLYLNGCVLSETKLDRYLRRLNADDWISGERTEVVLAKMVRQGYLIKVKDDSGEVTAWEYHLGPRAKVEIGSEGVLGMVRAVYGVSAPEDLEKRVRRNIGIEQQAKVDGPEAANGRKRKPGRRTRNREEGEGEDEEDD